MSKVAEIVRGFPILGQNIMASNINICIAVLLFITGNISADPCTYLNKTYDLGDVWVDAHACDYCECNQYGVQCMAGLNGGGCPLSNMTVAAGDPLCVYNFRLYTVGGIFKTLDGCNTCLCTERGMQCTAHACKRTGYDTYSPTPLYGDCQYNGKWYKMHSHWLANDGCNTCYCHTPGNYRGAHACTTSTCKCNHKTSVITG